MGRRTRRRGGFVRVGVYSRSFLRTVPLSRFSHRCYVHYAGASRSGGHGAARDKAQQWNAQEEARAYASLEEAQEVKCVRVVSLSARTCSRFRLCVFARSRSRLCMNDSLMHRPNHSPIHCTVFRHRDTCMNTTCHQCTYPSMFLDSARVGTSKTVQWRHEVARSIADRATATGQLQILRSAFNSQFELHVRVISIIGNSASTMPLALSI